MPQHYHRDPRGADNVILLPGALRAQVAATIERLIAVLDDLDGDADFEPSLGASEGYDGISRFDHGGGAEREDDGDAEEGGDAEPSLGSIGATADRQPQDGWSRGDGDDLEHDGPTVGDDEANQWRQLLRHLRRGGTLANLPEDLR